MTGVKKCQSFVWLLCAVAGAMIGRSKGQAANGFALGLLLGPFGILFALLMKGNRLTCHACRSSIHAEATFARIAGRRLMKQGRRLKSRR